jgi:hypothetical protein
MAVNKRMESSMHSVALKPFGTMQRDLSYFRVFALCKEMDLRF